MVLSPRPAGPAGGSLPHARPIMAVLVAMISWFAAPAARADTLVPGVIYAVGEKFDGSFNEAIYGAFEQFKDDTGIEYLEYEPADPGQLRQGIVAMARRGANLVVVVGFYYAQPLGRLAEEYPDIRFVLVDAVLEAPNVQSVIFREQEGAFLTGVLAAMASETGTIGFIAALDIPLLRKFIVGYQEGAAWIAPETTTMVNFIGTTPAAFNDPSTAGELARTQIRRGVDVVFAGAGNSNFGIFQTAEDLGALAIGHDSNQNGLYPGTILTSMLKRVDVAVLDALAAAMAGEWQPGVRQLGLAERGVDWAFDENNAPLITQEMFDAVERARAAIIDGQIVVTDPTAP